MEALRQIVDDAPDEIIVPIPTEWRHRRIEVILSAVDRPDPVQPECKEHPYQVLKVPRRVIAAKGMRCMSADRFVDTNIWVYAYTEEPRDIRGPQAKSLVEDGTRFVISTQVLIEYYAAMLKNGATDLLIQQNLESMMARCEGRLIDLSVIRLAHRLKMRYRFSYWDSLVISSALDAGCTILYSEDLQHGQHIEDGLHIVNPLLPQEPPSHTDSGTSTPPD